MVNAACDRLVHLEFLCEDRSIDCPSVSPRGYSITASPTGETIMHDVRQAHSVF
jgi:hypothetical protein